MDEQEIRSRVRRLLDSQPLAVLATVMDPHTALICLDVTLLKYVTRFQDVHVLRP